MVVSRCPLDTKNGKLSALSETLTHKLPMSPVARSAAHIWNKNINSHCKLVVFGLNVIWKVHAEPGGTSLWLGEPTIFAQSRNGRQDRMRTVTRGASCDGTFMPLATNACVKLLKSEMLRVMGCRFGRTMKSRSTTLYPSVLGNVICCN